MRLYAEKLAGEALLDALAGAQAIIPIRERTRFTAALLNDLPALELIAQTGGHAYHIDVAAADHFDKGGFGSWFSRNVVGIIPIKRGRPKKGEDVLAGCKDALARREILVVFPEGTRGEPEEMAQFKSGVARLAEFQPDAPVIPVYIQGAGRSLPREAKVLVPFNTTAVVGDPLVWTGSHHGFMEELRTRIEALRSEAPPMRWA